MHAYRPFRPAIAGSLLLLATAVSQPAFAQSNSSGSLSGRAAAGTTVVIANPQTGLHREISVPGNGRYQLRSLGIGQYEVSFRHADGSLTPARKVAIRVGTTTRLDDTAAKSD